MEGANDLEKFSNLAALTHKEQAEFCLNALWNDGAEARAEEFWVWKHKFDEFDIEKKAEGSSLDELNAHRFLEALGNTQSVKELRDKLREIGWVKRPMRFPLSVYIILEFKADWKEVVNASQGDNSEAIAQAAALLEEVQTMFDAATKAAEESKAAAEASAKAAAESKAAAEEAQATADAAKAAADEAAAAVAEVKSQEDAREAKTKELTEKSETGGIVSRNRAKQELQMHLSEDPLPLRKAKITLEAANRKAEAARNAAETKAQEAAAAAAEAEAKAQEAAAAATEAEAKAKEAEAARVEAEAKAQAADEARIAAEAKAKEADDARVESEAKAAEAAEAAAAAEAKANEAEEARVASEAAVVEAEAKVAEAEAFLEEEKNKSGSGQGSVWWLSRELEEKKKYMPSRSR